MVTTNFLALNLADIDQEGQQERITLDTLSQAGLLLVQVAHLNLLRWVQQRIHRVEMDRLIKEVDIEQHLHETRLATGVGIQQQLAQSKLYSHYRYFPIP